MEAFSAGAAEGDAAISGAGGDGVRGGIVVEGGVGKGCGRGLEV